MKRIVKIVTISLLCIVNAYSQDIEFSQYFNASLYLNPAFAGVYTKPTLNINYRMIGAGTETEQQLGQASFVLPIIVQGAEARQIGGVGISGYYRKTGLRGNLDVSGIMLNYAHTVNLGVISPDVLSF